MLIPGKSCVFTAVFSPSKAETITGALSIRTLSGNFKVSVSGTGNDAVIATSNAALGSDALSTDARP